VFLQIEEYEALRLVDYEMLNHTQASVIMDVSRPTLTRICARARHKVAEAFVVGKQIIIEGGKIYFDNEWFTCRSCRCFFNNPINGTGSDCPLCGSKDISHPCSDRETGIEKERNKDVFPETNTVII
jgi:hypothetical protein